MLHRLRFNTPVWMILLLSGMSFTPALSQTTRYQYNDWGFIAAVDGSREDVADITRYEYNQQGQLSAVINALGHRTEYTAYDANGRLLSWLDANGLATHITYNLAGQVVRYSPGGIDTQLQYDQVGNLVGILSRSGSWLYFQYDENNQITQVQDTLGNTLSYDYDSLGHITQQQQFDPQGQLTFLHRQVFDGLGRMIEAIDGAGHSQTYQYNKNDQLITVTDAKGQVSGRAYDALNRLSAFSNPRQAAGQVLYDDAGNIRQVKDYIGVITYHEYDAYDNLVRLHSRPTGETRYTYDSANNLTRKTDAKGVTTQYTYDALNRLSRIDYPNSPSAIRYTYDDGEHATGRLSLIQDSSGSTAYRYNLWGDVLASEHHINPANASSASSPPPYLIGYHYDPHRRLQQMTYPSGRILAYQYDAHSRLKGIDIIVDGETLPLVSAAQYLPFGSVSQWQLGNGQQLNQNFNLAYQMTQKQVVSFWDETPHMLEQINFSFDPNGNISRMDRVFDTEQRFDFDYDELSHLIARYSPSSEYLFTFDAVGNLFRREVDGESVIFNYNIRDKRIHLISIRGPHDEPLDNLSYDATGNLIKNSQYEYRYGDHHRLIEVLEGGQSLAQYTYNALNQRVIKYLPATDTTIHYLYNQQGLLIAEHDGTGAVIREYVYFNGQRLALLEGELQVEAASAPATILLDNHDSSTVSTGDWKSAQSIPGYTGADYLRHYPRGASPEGILVDNTDSGFRTSGEWAHSRSITGYQGHNYQWHRPNGASPQGITVDNTDSGFRTSGEWTHSRSVAGYQGHNYQWHRPNGASPQGITVDNTDSGFSTSGEWTHSRSVAGYQGHNYQWHRPNGASPQGITVDNTDSGFRTSGEWASSRSIAGYQGHNYQFHRPHAASPTGIHRDNSDAAVIRTGLWTLSTGVSGYWGSNAQAAAAGSGEAQLTWPLSIPEAGVYQVYARWTASGNRASNAPYRIEHAQGSDIIRVNQQSNGGQWVLLGRYTFAEGETAIHLSNDSDGYVIADAIKLTTENAPPNTASWTLDIPQDGHYSVYARWSAYHAYASNAEYTVQHAQGETTTLQDQTQNGGQWNLLGAYDFPAGTTQVTLTDVADGLVIADAIKVVPENAPPNTASWTLEIPEDGHYSVYARWSAYHAYASNAEYTVQHAQGETTTLQDQTQNGGQWNLLGAYDFPAGTTQVTLTDVADGLVIADAIQVVPENAPPNTASWTLEIPEDGHYQVYARWSAYHAYASNAEYTVQHAQGETTTLQDQTQNGGQWNLLGAYDFPAGTTQVTLTDVADGLVIADAIKVVPENAPPNTASWTLEIPEDGHYQVYARWSAYHAYASNAEYTVQHAQGETTTLQDQTQNGGQWNLLGAYDFPAGTTQVTLTDVADGLVIADAIKITAENAPPNQVIWHPQLDQAGEYEILARWSAYDYHAPNAVYRIHHSQGETPITQDQTQNGGRWNSLGIYTLDSNSTISLSDQADGHVIADAIQLIPQENSIRTDGGIFYIHTDHLDTPQLMTDAMGQVVWSASQTPFGKMQVNEDVDGDGQSISLNLRFPGQYFDRETGLHYNYFRYYDPELGRYITSDPIGIEGGLNTYLYADGNPINFYDPTGEKSASPTIWDCSASQGVGPCIMGGAAIAGAQHIADAAQACADGVSNVWDSMFNDAVEETPTECINRVDKEYGRKKLECKHKHRDDPEALKQCLKVEKAVWKGKLKSECDADPRVGQSPLDK